jgi:dihydropteroate synthase
MSSEMPEIVKQTNNMISLSGGRELSLIKPLVMGILNITPDSFSDGGDYFEPKDAVSQAKRIIAEGADIIDIGGESSRPGAEEITVGEEIGRVLPIIKAVREISDMPISIDTTKAEVAEEAIKTGADIINDISAMHFDERMVEVALKYETPIILMHMLGKPKTMQADPSYTDCVGEIKQFFAERINYCESKGINRDMIIIDPGIGFGKRLQDNLDIIKNLGQFKSFGCPVMIGSSRKSFIGMITKDNNKPAERIGGSIASVLAAIRNGCNIVRVHDVAATVEAINVYKAIEDYQ